MTLRDRLALAAAALWWGSAVAVGAWVVPLLFLHLATPAQAGQMAARLFAAQTWVAVACGLVILMALRPREAAGPGSLPPRAQLTLAWVAGGMLLALMLEFGVAPRILARQDLRLWHSVGTGLYALQAVAAGVAWWRLAGAGGPSRPAPGVSPGAPS